MECLQTDPCDSAGTSLFVMFQPQYTRLIRFTDSARPTSPRPHTPSPVSVNDMWPYETLHRLRCQCKLLHYCGTIGHECGAMKYVLSGSRSSGAYSESM